jgi:hypothetical protein
MLTGQGVCESCRCRVHRDLLAAPLLYVGMHLALPAGGTTDDDKVSGTPTPPTPLRTILLDAMSQMARTLAIWHHDVAVACTLAHLPTTRTVREGWVVDRASRILAARIEVACAIAPELAAQLAHDLHYGRRLIGHDHLVHRLVAPCPECGLRALVRRDGADTVYCRGCHAAWDEQLYHHLTRVLAAEATSDSP